MGPTIESWNPKQNLPKRTRLKVRRFFFIINFRIFPNKKLLNALISLRFRVSSRFEVQVGHPKLKYYKFDQRS